MIRIDFSPLTDYRQLGQDLYESEENWKKDLGNFILKWVDSSDSILAHTSGSTGVPKEIRLLKKHMRNSALMTGEFFHFEAGQKALLCLSINYIAGKMMVVRAIVHQMSMFAVEPTSTPIDTLSEEVDFAAMVPLQVHETIQSPEGLQKLGLIKQLLIGGSAIDHQLEKELQQLPNQVYASYGMTETISHIALRVVNGSDKSDWFTSLPGINLERDDRDCLVIDAPSISSEKITTNDVVELVGSRQFKVLGRADNIINSGGIKISPEAVEEKITHLIPAAFIIAGVPDEKLGNKLVLITESDQFNDINILRDSLDVYELPKQIFHVEALARTESGKIQRNESLKKIMA